MIALAPERWTVKPPWQTVAAALFSGTALFALIFAGVAARNNLALLLAVGVAALFLMLGVRAMFEGGCLLDPNTQRLRRWWGWGVTLRILDIPFSEIENVCLSYGLFPGSARAARQSWETYNLSIRIRGEDVVVRQGLRDLRRAIDLGEELSDKLGVAFVDGTRDQGRAEATLP